jgi:ribosomal protein S18 acetylase RimI-like enzyme
MLPQDGVMSLLTIDIRPAETEDADAVAAVHDAAWRHAYAGIIPYKALAAMINRRSGRWWERAIRRGTSIQLAEMNGRVCGYVTYGLNRAQALSQEGEIYELYLLPEYQGVGLGKRLFRAASRALDGHGCKGLVVWALEDNLNALRFYAGLGGSVVAQGSERFDTSVLRKQAFVWN